MGLPRHGFGELCRLLGLGGDVIHQSANGAFELGGNAGAHRVTFVLGPCLGLLLVLACDPRGFGCLVCRDQGLFGVCQRLGQIASDHDQDACFDQHDHRMQHDATKRASSAEDQRRQDKIEDQVVQRDSDGCRDDRPPIAERDDHRERGEEIHVDVHLPRMALHGAQDARDGQHHRDGQEQALRGAAALECHKAGEGGNCGHDGAQNPD